jgi:predicted transcriptional regulator
VIFAPHRAILTINNQLPLLINQDRTICVIHDESQGIGPMTGAAASPDYIRLTADITSAYVSNNRLSAAELPALIMAVLTALQKTTTGSSKKSAEPPVPAVPVRKSVTPDYIICLEDGKTFKSLKRHLRTQYNMTPAQYREKWGLPDDYPMVAPNYAKARSDLAKTIGLGRKHRKQATKVAVSGKPTRFTEGRRGKKAA